MRLLRVILTSFFAVLVFAVGFLVTAGVATASILALLLRRWLGRGSPSRPSVSRPAQPPIRSAGIDIIDVTATEVRADPTAR